MAMMNYKEMYKEAMRKTNAINLREALIQQKYSIESKLEDACEELYRIDDIDDIDEWYECDKAVRNRIKVLKAELEAIKAKLV